MIVLAGHSLRTGQRRLMLVASVTSSARCRDKRFCSLWQWTGRFAGFPRSHSSSPHKPGCGDSFELFYSYLQKRNCRGFWDRSIQSCTSCTIVHSYSLGLRTRVCGLRSLGFVLSPLVSVEFYCTAAPLSFRFVELSVNERLSGLPNDLQNLTSDLAGGGRTYWKLRPTDVGTPNAVQVGKGACRSSVGLLSANKPGMHLTDASTAFVAFPAVRNSRWLQDCHCDVTVAVRIINPRQGCLRATWAGGLLGRAWHLSSNKKSDHLASLPAHPPKLSPFAAAFQAGGPYEQASVVGSTPFGALTDATYS